MNSNAAIDISFDFRSDTPENKDPDTWSPTLASFHKSLWTKPLPCGGVFHLEYGKAPYYLEHQSDLGEFYLSSDTVVPTFKWLKNIEELVTEQDLSFFQKEAYTIGGMIIYPANQIQRKWTVNQARGCTREIGDRFDLTVECIRRHYKEGESPLSEVLNRYKDFFALFLDFQGYTDFFLLHDLVNNDCTAVNFFLPFRDFNSSAVPRTNTEYHEYRRSALNFIMARNQRIRDWAANHLEFDVKCPSQK